MDSIYFKALKKKEDLLEELQRIEAFLDTYKYLESETKNEHLSAAKANFTKKSESEEKEYFNVSGKLAGGPSDEVIQNLNKKIVFRLDQNQKRVRGTPPSEIIPLIEDMLRLKGKPMVRSEILKKLVDNGIEVGGGDKAKNVGTILWRNSDKFINLRGKGYWLRNQPCREVKYIPEDVKNNRDMI